MNTEKLFDIKDKIVIVTGASSGIGKCISLFFQNNGAQVICLARRIEKMNEMKQEAHGKYKLDFLKCDISNANNVKESFKYIENKYKKIDILINNAGITEKSNDITDHNIEQWDKVINTNLFGAYLCSKYAAILMKKMNYGKIINISSICGIMGLKNQVSYVASKSGLIGMTKALCVELGEYNITVNSIAPGYILTGMTNPKSSGCKYFKSRTVLNRVGKPEDLLGTVLLLASDASSYITGQTFIVDGGIMSNV